MTNQSLSSSLLSRLAGPTVEILDDGTPGIRNCDSNKTSPMKQLGISSWCIIHLCEIYDLTVIPMNTGVSSLCKKEYEQLHFNIFFAPKQDRQNPFEVSNCTTWRRRKNRQFQEEAALHLPSLCPQIRDGDKYHPSVPPKTLKIILPTKKRVQNKGAANQNSTQSKSIQSAVEVTPARPCSKL